MRSAFLGTGDFGVEVLKALHKEYGIALVITNPPQPSGRGLILRPGPILSTAQSLGIEIWVTEDPNAQDFIARLSNLQWDCFLVCDYGVILSPQLLALPRLGSLGVHPSLLPNYRGAAPMRRALMAGEKITGVSIFLMEKGVDSGPILDQKALEIGPDEDYGSLAQSLSRLGAELLCSSLKGWFEHKLRPRPQVASPASYAPKLRKEELIIDWAKDARTIANLIRALSPSPLARTSFRGDMVAIQAARPLSLTPEAPAGTILSDKGPLIVAAAKGVLELLSLKPMGRRLMSGADFRNGYRPSAGERFGR